MSVSTVAVLRGGPSAEYDVSMQTGAGVLGSLSELKIKTKDITISRKGEWLIEGFVKSPEIALTGVDVVFIALHGAYGEDGSVQRILERLAVPYTGSKPFASAVAMNKLLTKQHLADLDIKTPQSMRVTKEKTKDPFQTALGIGTLFGPRYFIKPMTGGSSIGIQTAENVQELGLSLRELLKEYDDLLVEELIVGREATVGILENYRGSPLYDLPTVEIIPPAESKYFAADVKYTGATEEICPGRFTKTEKGELARIAQTVHKELGLRHYSRSDYIVADDGIYFLEVNTLPGLTKESLFPKSIEAVGGKYGELVEHLIAQATL
ncbi:MAG: D-alanine-D-alanine ligase [Acidimicrobiales bacterium]|jgi:D-alanine-D-alanine ligase